MQFINWSQCYLYWVFCIHLLQDFWNPFHFRFKVRKMYLSETSEGYHCLPCCCYATVQAVVDCFLDLLALYCNQNWRVLGLVGGGAAAVGVRVNPCCSCVISVSNISFSLLKYIQFYLRLAFLLVNAEKDSDLCARKFSKFQTLNFIGFQSSPTIWYWEEY